MIRRRASSAVICLILLTAGGCQSAPSGRRSLDASVQSYYGGYYASSYEDALAAMQDDSVRQEAAYVAGLAAYHLGDRAGAERSWQIAAGSSDPDIAARANAMLGILRLEQGQDDDAARLLSSASLGLSGDDAHQASYFASVARGAPHGTSLGARMDESREFVLQAGAFRERDRAEAMAREVSGLTGDQHDLKPIQIVASRDERGRSLFLVHFGSFRSRQEAAGERARLGRREYIVVRPPDHGAGGDEIVATMW